MAEHSEQGEKWEEMSERGSHTGPCRTLDFTLFSSGTRGNEMGRRNTVGLCLATLPLTKRLPRVTQTKRLAVNDFLVFPMEFA